MAADQGHHVLQYYINIIANAQQLLDTEDFVWNLSKLNSRHITFIVKSLHKWKLETGF